MDFEPPMNTFIGTPVPERQRRPGNGEGLFSGNCCRVDADFESAKRKIDNISKDESRRLFGLILYAFAQLTDVRV